MKPFDFSAPLPEAADGCAAPDDYLHNATLTNFYLQFGDVQTIGELIALLDAGTASGAAAAE